MAGSSPPKNNHGYLLGLINGKVDMLIGMQVASTAEFKEAIGASIDRIGKIEGRLEGWTGEKRGSKGLWAVIAGVTSLVVSTAVGIWTIVKPH